MQARLPLPAGRPGVGRRRAQGSAIPRARRGARPAGSGAEPTASQRACAVGARRGAQHLGRRPRSSAASPPRPPIWSQSVPPGHPSAALAPAAGAAATARPSPRPEGRPPRRTARPACSTRMPPVEAWPARPKPPRRRQPIAAARPRPARQGRSPSSARGHRRRRRAWAHAAASGAPEAPACRWCRRSRSCSSPPRRSSSAAPSLAQ